MHPFAMVLAIISAATALVALGWQIAQWRMAHSERVDLHPYFGVTFGSAGSTNVDVDLYATVTNLSRVDIFIDSVIAQSGESPGPPIGAPKTWLRSNDLLALRPEKEVLGPLRPKEARTYILNTAESPETKDRVIKILRNSLVVKATTSTGQVETRKLGNKIGMLIDAGLIQKATERRMMESTQSRSKEADGNAGPSR
jgi:hypothetical protein